MGSQLCEIALLLNCTFKNQCQDNYCCHQISERKTQSFQSTILLLGQTETFCVVKILIEMEPLPIPDFSGSSAEKILEHFLGMDKNVNNANNNTQNISHVSSLKNVLLPFRCLAQLRSWPVVLVPTADQNLSQY